MELATNLPIKLSPILDWPPNFLLLFKWLASYWLHISSIIIEVLLAIFIFYLFHPSAEEMKIFLFRGLHSYGLEIVF